MFATTSKVQPTAYVIWNERSSNRIEKNWQVHFIRNENKYGASISPNVPPRISAKLNCLPLNNTTIKTLTNTEATKIQAIFLFPIIYWFIKYVATKSYE
jgi:hypothetical protein